MLKQNNLNSGRKMSGNPHITNKVKVTNERDPSKSISKIAQEFCANRTTVRIFLKDFNLKSYTFSAHLKLPSVDEKQQLASSLLTKEVADNPNFLKQMWSGDEAHFHLNGDLTEQSNPQDRSH